MKQSLLKNAVIAGALSGVIFSMLLNDHLFALAFLVQILQAISAELEN